MKQKVKAFGGGCPKCAARTGIQTHCPGCKEIRGQEHLHCACTVCGYSWAEETADKRPSRKGKR